MAGQPAVATSIAVFARAPVPGQAKTRLIPLLGAEGAARLQRQLIRRSLATACAACPRGVSLWVAGDTAHPFIEASAREFGVDVFEQRGEDLGEKMAAAFDALLAGVRYARCVLIGTDCPSLSAGDLAAALAALDDADVVVQPADDGGYVLIGLRAPCPGVFAGVQWGTATVMNATRGRIRALGLRARELPARPDLDTPDDHARALAAGWISE